MSTIAPAPSLLSRTFARGLLKIAAAAGCIAAAAMGGCGSTAMPTRISQDTEVLGQIQASPNAVPSEEIQKCAGVAIIKYTAAGVGIGAGNGEGILLRKLSNGWSKPLAVSVGDLSIGAQIGAQGVNMILVFQNDAAVLRFASQGTSAVAFAQGTAGRDTGTTMKEPPKPIDAKAYSISSGLFAGAVVGTVSVSVDTKVNEATYGSGVSMLDILEGRAQEQPGMMRLERLLGGKSGS